MIPKSLFEKIRRIEITTSRMVTDVFAGEYHSVFKGQGIEFDEVREYAIGDDVRMIDWNVTARTGTAHIKKFIEERELTVMVMVDASSSEQFASVNTLKSQLAAEISAVLAFSAIRNNDKVGLIIFTDRIEKFIPPAKGTRHVLRIIREILYFKPKGKRTNISAATEYLNRVVSRRSIAFLISDFLENEGVARSLDLKRKMSIANKRHDLIAITLNDPRESLLPDCGLIALHDAETGEGMIVDSSNAQIRRQYEIQNQDRIKKRENLFRSIGMDFINISTDKPYAVEIIKFFLKRRHRG
jgi:uncharacterized protein (DUF58 family)